MFVTRPPVPPPDPIYPNRGRPLSDVPTDVVKRCRTHGDWPHGYYGGRYRCKRCAGEAVTRRNQKVKLLLVDEAGGACAVCGYERAINNLHFHHADPALKSFGINGGHGRGLEARRAEAAKCVLVCANCHGEIEAGLITSPPAGTRWAGDPPDPA